MNYFVYILKSLKSINWYYVGSCIDIEKRFKQHEKGSVRSTKSKRPLKIIYTEAHETKKIARIKKNYLKSPQGYLTKKESLITMIHKVRQFLEGITS